MSEVRIWAAMLALVAVASCSNASVDQEQVRADWCERAEPWASEFVDQTSRYEQDPSALTDADLSRLDELHSQMLADPVPEDLATVIGTLRGELPDDEARASSDALHAGEQLATYLRDGCGTDLSEPASD